MDNQEINEGNQERKLSSEELEQLLKEVETEPEAKILPDAEKPKRRKKKKKIRIDMIIAAIVAIILVVCVIFMIVHFASKSSSNTAKEASENALQDEKYPEISDVVSHYLKAFLIKDSNKRHQELARYVDNMGAIDEGEIGYKDYITSYSDIECYTKNGLKPNTYVVYAYSQTKFKNIATAAPSLDVLYVIVDSKTGNVYVHNGIKSNSDIAKYIAEVSKDNDVVALKKDVQKELNEACESDKYLKDFITKLQASKQKATQAATKKK
ncbi:MAG: hypothetical protein K6E58_05030 [Eubacterium sp.]|nr:hypothetical protein [Eubacterium sp.]